MLEQKAFFMLDALALAAVMESPAGAVAIEVLDQVVAGPGPSPATWDREINV